MATNSPTMLVFNPMEALLSNYSSINMVLIHELGLATLTDFVQLCMIGGLLRACPVC